MPCYPATLPLYLRCQHSASSSCLFRRVSWGNMWRTIRTNEASPKLKYLEWLRTCQGNEFTACTLHLSPHFFESAPNHHLRIRSFGASHVTGLDPKSSDCRLDDNADHMPGTDFAQHFVLRAQRWLVGRPNSKARIGTRPLVSMNAR